MTINFTVSPLNNYGQASITATRGGSTRPDKGTLSSLTHDQHAELTRRLTAPRTSEAEPGESAPVAWHLYDDIAVGITRSTVDGRIVVHMESLRPINTEHGGKDSLPVRVTRDDDNEVVYEGDLS